MSTSNLGEFSMSDGSEGSRKRRATAEAGPSKSVRFNVQEGGTVAKPVPDISKIVEEIHEFNDKWTYDYFFIFNQNKAICLICKESTSAINEINLRHHYETEHKNEYDKFENQMRQEKIDLLREVVEAEQDALAKSKEQSLASIKASLRISTLIIDYDKSFSDGEYIRKCILATVDELMPEQKKKFEDIDVTYSAVAQNVDYMSTQIFNTLKEKTARFQCFSVALVQSNDVATSNQLLIFIRGIDEQFHVTEEIAALKSVPLKARGRDIIMKLSHVFKMYNLHWDKLKSVTTEGGVNMTGHVNGLLDLINEKLLELNINLVPLQIHSIIHQNEIFHEFANLKNVMYIVAKCIAFIRKNGKEHQAFQNLLCEVNTEYKDVNNFSEVKWVSRGNVLKDFFECAHEIEVFFTQKGINVQQLSDFKLLCKLAFLVDLTEYLNDFKMRLQSKGRLINGLFTETKSFQLKIKLFISQMAKNTFCHFPTLEYFVANSNNNTPCPTKVFIRALRILNENLTYRFQFLAAKEMDILMFENPLIYDLARAPENLQLELTELRSNNEYKNKFDVDNLIGFYASLPENQFPNLRKFAKSMICVFSSTYLCEETYKKMSLIKSRYRSGLRDDHIKNMLNIAMTQSQPDLNELAITIQKQQDNIVVIND